MKQCTICKETKPLDDFVKRSNRRSGRQPYCSVCHNIKSRNAHDSGKMKDYDLKRSYGITLDDYNDMYRKQNGRCKICNRHIDEIMSSRKKHLCVDHCHKTKVIRGLLCDKCNRGLGLFNDSSELLMVASEYLREFK
jgi:hypothetical protein